MYNIETQQIIKVYREPCQGVPGFSYSVSVYVVARFILICEALLRSNQSSET
jgi:hypothetical protein